MRLPTMARQNVPTLATLLVAGVLIAGCAGEATAPPALQQRSQLGTSPFVPSDAQKALKGLNDGTYSFKIDPEKAQTLALGASRLDIPADAICKLGRSGYGPGHWDDKCDTQEKRFTITAIVRDAATDHPSVSFEPALRFSPDKTVMLYLHVTNNATLDASRIVKYCSGSKCIDESVADRTLISTVDLVNRVVYRRIKHFSGYVITQLADDGLGL